MSAFSQNKWKYSTIGLLAILAVGFSFPQAFAHVTSSVSHNVTHILDALAVIDSNVDDIKAQTDNLPADPASSTDISNAVADIGATQSVRIDVTVNPADGDTQIITLIPSESGKTFSGVVSMRFNPQTTGNVETLFCNTIGANEVILADTSSFVDFSGSFACSKLTLALVDLSDGTDDPALNVSGAVQYTTSSDVTDLT